MPKYTSETLLQTVREMLADQLGLDVPHITPDSRIGEDLHADSLDFVEIVMAVEEHFDIEVEDEDAEKIKTVADIVSYLERAGVTTTDPSAPSDPS